MRRAKTDRCNIFGKAITLFCRAVDKLELEGTPPDDDATAVLIGQIRLIERMCEEEGFTVSPATMARLRNVYVAPYVNFPRIRAKGTGVVEDGDGEADELEVAAALDPGPSNAGTFKHGNPPAQGLADMRTAQVTAPPPVKRPNTDTTDARSPRKRARLSEAAAPHITPHLARRNEGQLLPSPLISETPSKSIATPPIRTVRPLIVVKRVKADATNTTPARKRARINEAPAPLAKSSSRALVQSVSRKPFVSGHTAVDAPPAPQVAAIPAGSIPQLLSPRRASLRSQHHIAESIVAPAVESNPTPRTPRPRSTPTAVPVGGVPQLLDSPRRASLRSQHHNAASTTGPTVESIPPPRAPRRAAPVAAPAPAPPTADPIEAGVYESPSAHRRGRPRSHPRPFPIALTPPPTAHAEPSPAVWSRRLAAAVVEAEGHMATAMKARRLADAARVQAEQAIDNAVEAQLAAAWNLSRKKAALADWEAREGQ